MVTARVIPRRLPRRFLDRLDAPVPETEVLRNERAIALARAFLILGMVIVAPPEAVRRDTLPALVRILTAYYFAHSLAVLILVWARPTTALRLRVGIHLADLAWVAVVTVRPGGVYLVFSTFTLLAAAYRWGFRETAATAATAFLVLPLQIAVLTAFNTPRFRPAPEAGGIAVRVGHLITVGLLLGYLAERAVPDSGSAYVFRKVGGTWVQEAELVAGDAATGDFSASRVSSQGMPRS